MYGGCLLCSLYPLLVRSIYPDSSYGKRRARLGKKFFLGSSGFSLAKKIKMGPCRYYPFFLSVANYYRCACSSIVCFSRIAVSGVVVFYVLTGHGKSG